MASLETNSAVGSPIRVAVVQAAPTIFNREATLAKLKVLSKQAAANGAKVILFPEAFISAYPRGSAFGAIIQSFKKRPVSLGRF
jgi:nitrilase